MGIHGQGEWVSAPGEAHQGIKATSQRDSGASAGEAHQCIKATSQRDSGASAEVVFIASKRKMFSAGPLSCLLTSVAKHPSLIRVRITLGNRV